MIFFIVIGVVTILLFGLLARGAVRAPLESRRPATTELVSSILGLVGILAFFLSPPTGLAMRRYATLGPRPADRVRRVELGKHPFEGAARCRTRLTNTCTSGGG